MKNSICQYKPFIGVKLKKLTPPLVQSYINERVKGGLSPNSIQKHYCIIHKCLDFQQIMKAHGSPCRFHDLRHSAVDTLRKGGCDAKDIQSWLGHSDISTTANIYSHFLYSAKKDMADSIEAALN